METKTLKAHQIWPGMQIAGREASGRVSEVGHGPGEGELRIRFTHSVDDMICATDRNLVIVKEF